MTGASVGVTDNKYINTANGRIGNLNGSGVTDKISVVAGIAYKLHINTAYSASDARGFVFYDNGAYISGIPYIANQTDYEFTIPEKANQIALTVKMSDAATDYFTLFAIENLSELTDFVNNASAAAVKRSEFTYDVFAFDTVGIVGDSLASGCSNYKDSQDVWHALGRKKFAWGKFLEKRLGCTVTLFSQGGMSTRSWFTNSEGYAKAQQNPCECYYIGLGVNDYASLGDSYLGSSSDINVGNEDANADTFYGNYAKIIAKLTAIQPRCKIFCFTMADDQSASQTRLNYDTAIRTVVALYDNAYLLDLAGDTFYTSLPVSGTFYGAHYLATGYSMMADHIHALTNEYMLQHMEDFSDVQWITNNYPNTDIVS